MQRIDTNSIAFYIAPKINSANRMSDPMIAFNLLITDDEKEAKELAKHLGNTNRDRQDLLEEYCAHVISEIDRKGNLAKKIQTGKEPPIIMVNGEWPTGLSGLIASRLADAYGVPAICSTINDWGEVAASARSVSGVNIISIIESVSEDLHKFGGHSGAGGFICKVDKYDTVERKIKERATSIIPLDRARPILRIDAEINLSQVSIRSAQQVSKLGPFGESFPQPLFLVRDVNLIEKKTMGDGKHLSATVSKNGEQRRVVFFSHDLELEMIEEDQKFDLVFNLDINYWKGRPEIQMIARDWRVI